MIEKRILAFRGLITILFVFVTLVLFKVQVMEGKRYRSLSEKNRIRLIPLEAARGRILDRQGILLAGSRPSFDLALIPEDFDRKDIPFLSQTLGLESQVIESKLRSARETPFRPVVIQRDVAKEILFQLEEKKPTLKGFLFQNEGLRYYPQGPMASHVLGYIGKIAKEEYENQSEPIYDADDFVGKKGIEKVFDLWLRGEEGGQQMEVSATGRPVRLLSKRVPKPGKDLTLSIDAELQSKIWGVVGEKKAVVCLMELERDEILALVSKPDFDPNIFVSPSLLKERLETIQDKIKSPLVDRAVGAAFPPGSVFKLVTALAGLESGAITPATTFVCRGSYRLGPRSRSFRCWRDEGHGSLNLEEAIQRSCNVYFFQAGLRVGPELLARYSKEFGLGRRLPIELPSLDEGAVPDPQWKWRRFRERWYPGETLSYAIGQGYVLTSPVQLLRVVATIAKNGVLSEPTLIKDRGGKRRVKRVSVRSGNLGILRRAMLRVVEADHGTGRLARVDFTQVAGKTGTAQVVRGEPHAWFAGFFPYQEPRFAVVVFIEHGRSGGQYAADLARRVIECVREHPVFGTLRHVVSSPAKV